jgi:(E)-4-hydroxy-3-methylbut-2-enyl-diphosphate synthase
VHELWRERIPTPVIFFQHYNHPQAAKEDFQLQAAADMGALLFDGLTDGIFLYNDAPRESTPLPHSVGDETAYAILQATRTRTTKAEYISCPGCGRTLYDLSATIARVKAATAHLTGLKIAIMGCIVNGPGEMADADYGYVGAARGKISLYRGKVCVERNIPAEDAVEKLLALIEADGYGRQE